MPSVRFVIGLSLRAKNVPYPPEDMGYPLREFLAERYYFLTSRTIDSQLLLRPDPEVNEILGEWLVRAQQQTGIELVVYVVMSNHWHAIVRAPQQNIDRFVSLFKSQSSRQVNELRDARRGTIYQRRYSCEPILDQESLLDRIIYILSNPVAAGLVDRAEDWPGLSSLLQLIENQSVSFPVFDRTAWHAAGAPEDRTPYMEQAELRIVLPEFLAQMDPEERAAMIRERLEAVEAEHRQERESRGASVLGGDKVLEEDPCARPKRTNRSKRPLCHTSRIELWVEYREHWRHFRGSYRLAAQRYRAGDLTVEFPEGSFPPWIRKVA